MEAAISLWTKVIWKSHFCHWWPVDRSWYHWPCAALAAAACGDAGPLLGRHDCSATQQLEPEMYVQYIYIYTHNLTIKLIIEEHQTQTHLHYISFWSHQLMPQNCFWLYRFSSSMNPKFHLFIYLFYFFSRSLPTGKNLQLLSLRHYKQQFSSLSRPPPVSCWAWCWWAPAVAWTAAPVPPGGRRPRQLGGTAKRPWRWSRRWWPPRKWRRRCPNLVAGKNT